MLAFFTFVRNPVPESLFLFLLLFFFQHCRAVLSPISQFHTYHFLINCPSYVCSPVSSASAPLLVFSVLTVTQLISHSVNQSANVTFCICLSPQPVCLGSLSAAVCFTLHLHIRFRCPLYAPSASEIRDGPGRPSLVEVNQAILAWSFQDVKQKKLIHF